MFFIRFPFFKYTCCLVAGIVTIDFTHISPDIFVPLLATSVIVYLFFEFSNTIIGNSSTGILCLFIIYFSGITIRYYQNDGNKESQISNAASISAYEGRIYSEISETSKFYKFELKCEEIYVKKKWINCGSKILVYLDKFSYKKPAYGDYFLVCGTPQLIPEPSSIFDFDYKSYLKNKNVFHQHFVKIGDAKKLPLKYHNPIFEYAYKCRAYLSQLYEQYLKDPNAYGIAKALVFGSSDGLERDVKLAYASTGTIHVLAVSGMHVGLIYAFFAYILSFLLKRRGGEWYFLGVLLGILWFYAFVTGFSASILRAVVMFSFFAISKSFNKSYASWNIMFLSMFILLVYNSAFLYDAGFQLSYAALAGILFIHPIIYQPYKIKIIFIDEIWKIVSVSISAQVFVFPLCLWYFHQFPLIFPLSNLLIIPFSTILMYGSLLGIAIFQVPILGEFYGNLLENTILYMNQLTMWLEKIPFSSIQHIYLSPIGLVCSFGIMLTIVMFVKFRKLKYLYSTVLFTILICAIQLWQIQSANCTRQLIAFILNKNVHVAYQNKAKLVMVSKVEHNDNIQKIALLQNKLRLIEVLYQDSSSEVFAIDNKIIYLSGRWFNPEAAAKAQLVFLNFNTNSIKLEFLKNKDVFLTCFSEKQLETHFLNKLSKIAKSINWLDSHKENIIAEQYGTY